MHFHSQNFSVSSCFTIGRCARPKSKKEKVFQNYEGSIWNRCVNLLWPSTELRKLDLVPLLSFLGRTVFEKDLPFIKIRQKLDFIINDHLKFVIIVCLKHLSKVLWKQKSLLFWMQKYVNWRNLWTLYLPLSNIESYHLLDWP